MSKESRKQRERQKLEREIRNAGEDIGDSNEELTEFLGELKQFNQANVQSIIGAMERYNRAAQSKYDNLVHNAVKAGVIHKPTRLQRQIEDVVTSGRGYNPRVFGNMQYEGSEWILEDALNQMEYHDMRWRK